MEQLGGIASYDEARAAVSLFSGFPGRRSVLTAGIRTGCSHYTSTHVQTLSVLSLHHTFIQESEVKKERRAGMAEVLC